MSARPGRSLAWLPAVAAAAGVMLLLVAARAGGAERAICNCDAAVAAAGAAATARCPASTPLSTVAAVVPSGSASGELEALSKLTAVRAELAEALAKFEKLRRLSDRERASAAKTIAALQVRRRAARGAGSRGCA
jgi:hypothetical protein